MGGTFCKGFSPEKVSTKKFLQPATLSAFKSDFKCEQRWGLSIPTSQEEKLLELLRHILTADPPPRTLRDGLWTKLRRELKIIEREGVNARSPEPVTGNVLSDQGGGRDSWESRTDIPADVGRGEEYGRYPRKGG